jgi:hypothetical protein
VSNKRLEEGFVRQPLRRHPRHLEQQVDVALAALVAARRDGRVVEPVELGERAADLVGRVRRRQQLGEVADPLALDRALERHQRRPDEVRGIVTHEHEPAGRDAVEQAGAAT